MAIITKSPQKVMWDDRPSVFLAGTIDNGASEDWQQKVTSALKHLDIQIVNPRRETWDSSWKQSISNPHFKQQVEWELDCLDKVSYIFVYFAPTSVSPITLLELGLHANTDRLIVVCPDGYWRKGNIEVVSEVYGFPLFDDITNGLVLLKEKLSST